MARAYTLLYNYTWSIVGTAVSDEPIDGNDNAVITARYVIRATDGTRHAEVEQSTGINYVPGEFTPFYQLTEDIVLGWVRGQLGEQGIADAEANVGALLDYHATMSVPKNLPWERRT